MRKIIFLSMLLAAFLFPGITAARNNAGNQAYWPKKIVNQVVDDYKHYYTGYYFPAFLATVGVGAAFANTNADKEIQEFWQDNIVTTDVFDDVLEIFEGIGKRTMAQVPLYLFAMFTAEICDCSDGSYHWQLKFADWGQRSLRTWALGAPQQILLNQFLGGKRPPGESAWGNSGTHGVSGHAFLGAIPILNAAFVIDNIWLKSSLFVLSTFPAIARVYNNDHYFSQSLMGWAFAFWAAKSIDDSATKNHYQKTAMVMPVPVKGGMLLAAAVEF